MDYLFVIYLKTTKCLKIARGVHYLFTLSIIKGLVLEVKLKELLGTIKHKKIGTYSALGKRGCETLQVSTQTLLGSGRPSSELTV